jgi:iron complex outermembrane receptor protein/vitamin B12 transporter
MEMEKNLMAWKFVRSVVCVLAMLLSGAAAWAADDASIKGSILDPLGARVAGAKVRLLRDGQPVKQTTSDAQGDFSFDTLPEGRYQIEATAEGFQTRTTDRTFVAAGAHPSFDVSLPISQFDQDLVVTAAANEVLPSQIGAPVTLLDSQTIASLGKTDVLEALRLVPGSQVVQTGARGGATSMFIRGGNSNFNKVVIDGIPANDIGGGIDLAQFTTTGVDRIEVLREANSVVFGSDALSGVINVTTHRGTSRVPEGTYSIDGGNLNMLHQAVGFGGAIQRFDYFSEFSYLNTDNDLPNNAYRNKTYSGRFGIAVAHNTDVSATVRWIDRRFESPNGFSLYGTPDDSFQTNQLSLIGLGSQTQITNDWQASIRFGMSDQRTAFTNPTPSGTPLGGNYVGNVVTLQGANGYSATGRAILDFAGTYPSLFTSRSARQGVYAQTSYQVLQDLRIGGGGHFEREQGFTNPDADPTTTRNNGGAWVEGTGTLLHRVTVTAGLGYEHNAAFQSAFSPRVSVAAFLRNPTSGEFWSDTRLTLNAGKGIKAPSISAEQRSLYTLLQRTPAGQAIATAAGIGPIGPERGRNVDVGVEQGMWHGKARLRVAYFNNEFFDLIEFVSKGLLPQLGVPGDAANASGGANVNSQSFKAQGTEVSFDVMVARRLRVATAYTYLDAVVTKSLSSGALTPSFNPNIPGVPIGAFSPLLNERPFRRPRNVGNMLVSYTQGRGQVALSGYFAGKADDSTFLSDANFGNTMLLPNRDLDFAYQKLDLSGSYQIHPRLRWYTTVENLLNQHYEPAFGFPALPINLRTGVTVTVGGGH